jgi:bisphosphoglycerate-independent phosphoglycerate mutase (AlkP superfamily)
VKGASERGAKRIRLHILTDGRDVLDGSSVGFVETIENDLAQLREKGVDARVASGGGRMYVTMDRYEVYSFDSVINFCCLAVVGNNGVIFELENTSCPCWN